MRSARAKLMITKGMARFRAAKAVLPRICPHQHAVDKLIDGRGQHPHGTGEGGLKKQPGRRGFRVQSLVVHGKILSCICVLILSLLDFPKV